MASWVEHTMREIQVEKSLLESHDKFFEEKFDGLKIKIQSLMYDFKGALQSYGEDIADSRRLCCRDALQALKPLPKLGS